MRFACFTKLLLICLPLCAQPSLAADRATVCAKYQTQNGWSDPYQVQATIEDGSELNAATSSLNYQAFSKYVVIFWAQNQASVIKLDNAFGLYAAYQEGIDQEGRHWQVAQGYGICY